MESKEIFINITAEQYEQMFHFAPKQFKEHLALFVSDLGEEKTLSFFEQYPSLDVLFDLARFGCVDLCNKYLIKHGIDLLLSEQYVGHECKYLDDMLKGTGYITLQPHRLEGYLISTPEMAVAIMNLCSSFGVLYIGDSDKLYYIVSEDLKGEIEAKIFEMTEQNVDLLKRRGYKYFDDTKNLLFFKQGDITYQFGLDDLGLFYTSYDKFLVLINDAPNHVTHVKIDFTGGNSKLLTGEYYKPNGQKVGRIEIKLT